MMAAAMDHDVEVPGRVEVDTECGRGPGPHDGDLRAAARPETARRQVSRVRLVQPALAARAARPGRRGARPGPATPAGRACSTRSAPTSTTSGTTPTSRWRAIPRSQQAVRFGLFHVLQASARAERRAIPGKGLTGTGYDGHAFWDTEGFVLPVLTYTAAARRRRRAALAGVDPRSGPRRGPPNWTWRAPASPGARSAGRSARRTGRPARRPGTSTPTSPWRSSATASSPGDQSLEEECGLEVLVETARLWMSLGHHDRHGALAPRRGHRARRVHGGGARQRLHQPDGRATTCAIAAAACEPPSRAAPAPWASPPRRRRHGATPPTPCTSRTTRASACTSSARGSPRCASGTSTTTRRIRCCCTSPTCGSIRRR